MRSAWRVALTPHLIYTKKFSSVLAVVEQVPKLYVLSKHTVYELLPSLPVVRAEHVGNCMRDVLGKKLHVHPRHRNSLDIYFYILQHPAKCGCNGNET